MQAKYNADKGTVPQHSYSTMLKRVQYSNIAIATVQYNSKHILKGRQDLVSGDVKVTVRPKGQWVFG